MNYSAFAERYRLLLKTAATNGETAAGDFTQSVHTHMQKVHSVRSSVSSDQEGKSKFRVKLMNYQT